MITRSDMVAKESPRISKMILRGKPSGSHVRTNASLVPATWNFASGLFMLKSFCPSGVREGSSPLSAAMGPAQVPVKSRLGAGPPGPLSFHLLYIDVLKPARCSAGEDELSTAANSV